MRLRAAVLLAALGCGGAPAPAAAPAAPVGNVSTPSDRPDQLELLSVELAALRDLAAPVWAMAPDQAQTDAACAIADRLVAAVTAVDAAPAPAPLTLAAMRGDAADVARLEDWHVTTAMLATGAELPDACTGTGVEPMRYRTYAISAVLQGMHDNYQQLLGLLGLAVDDDHDHAGHPHAHGATP